MTGTSLTPMAKSLHLCDGHIGYPGQKTDLIGLFGAIRPANYPHRQRSFVIFAHRSWSPGSVRCRSSLTFASPRMALWYVAPCRAC